jgi:hypothetical protein
MALALLAPLALPMVGQALGGLLGGGQQAGGSGDPISKLLKTLMGSGGGLPNPVQGILKTLGI